MNLDPVIISNFLLAITVYIGTMAAKYSSQSRALKKVVKALRLENEALWEDRHNHRRIMAQAGVKFPPPHPVLRKLELEQELEEN